MNLLEKNYGNHPRPPQRGPTPAANGPVSVAELSHPKFSQELRDLAHQFSGRRVRLSEILTATQGRGTDLLLLLIGLPFLTPIPLPGFSAPFGLVIVTIGARLALGQRPWLPEKVLQRELPARFITRLLGAASRIVRWMEVLLRPRLKFLHEQRVYRHIAGALIMISGLLLLLPLPIPLSNGFPALTVVLLAASAIERDGLFFIAGCVAFTATLAYFGLLVFGGAHVIDNFWHSIVGL